MNSPYQRRRAKASTQKKKNRAPPSLALVSSLNYEAYAPFYVKKENQLVDVFELTDMENHPTPTNGGSDIQKLLLPRQPAKD